MLSARAGRASEYRRPPAPIPEILEASPLPAVSVDPTRRFLVLAERSAMPPVAKLARTVSAGAGTSTARGGAARLPAYVGLALERIDSGEVIPISAPPGAGLGPLLWSPDASRFAFLRTHDDDVGLWIAGPGQPRARRLEAPPLDGSLAGACHWMPDSVHLLCRTVPRETPAPVLRPAPVQPIVAGPLQVLANAVGLGTGDDALAQSLRTRLSLLNTDSGIRRALGPRGAIEWAEPSPDGSHVLVSRLVRPDASSPAGRRSPSRVVEIWTVTGEPRRVLAAEPTIGDALGPHRSARPRGFRWVPSEPATVVWAEPLRGAPPLDAGPASDRLVRLAAPFSGPPEQLVRLEHAFSGIAWVASGKLALVQEYDPATRRRRTWAVGARGGGSAGRRLLWDRSVDDAYGDPGMPLPAVNAAGRPVIASHEGAIYLAGEGASPGRVRPFLDRLDLDSLTSERLWESSPVRHETAVELLSAGEPRVLVRSETASDPPNVEVLDLRDGSRRPLTRFRDPAPQLHRAPRRFVAYRRADGVALSATLHLPPDRAQGERLPLLLWAYPRKHHSADTTGQTTASLQGYSAVEGPSPLLLVTQGYAVMVADMPVVGGSRTANDTFVEQIVANARAAIDTAVGLGIADPDRVAVGGHSYGAFMAVNLLAHSDLFRTGIALSGAYNRTLTPFGFQTERRTLWEAPTTYLQISPFLHADRIDAPLLLIHGERDEHAGTPALQSELLYRAIGANGGTARLVILPFEGHVYRARESVLHTVAEMVDWLDRYLKRGTGVAVEETAPAG